MNEEIEKVILKLEPTLNERDEKIKKREELIKDINDFTNLLPELNNVITDLEKKVLQSNDEKTRQELDSYLKERVLYYDTIQAFTKEALNLKSEIESIPEELRESEERLIHLFYQRRNFSKKIEYYENQEILNAEEQQDYENALENLEKIDEEILKNYNYLSEDDWQSENKDEEIIQETSSLLMPLSSPDEREQWMKERKEILSALKEIENSKGRKITYKDIYYGQRFSKRIPRHLRGKYGILMGRLKKIEKILNKEYLPKISIDETLINTMTSNQKIQYLANLMLQIEAFTGKSELPCIVNGKMIPFEYKIIYEEIVKKMKNLRGKKVNYYRYTIDINYYDKLDIHAKLNYIDDLANKVTNNFINNPIDFLWNGKKYRIDKNDVPLFNRLSEMSEQAQKECQEEIKRFEQENEEILNHSNNVETEKLTINNEQKSVLKTFFKKFIQNRIYIKALEAAKNKITQIKFDQEYYNSLNSQEKISYCENTIQQIISKKHHNPIKFMLNQSKVEIDEIDINAFIQASSKLLESQDKMKEHDLTIDEEYVKNLNDEKKIEYYTHLIHEVCSKPIKEKMSQEIQEIMYSFDKKYALLTESLANRIQAIRIKSSNPVQVKRVEKSKKIDKIKKFLKKKAVRIALSVGALVAVVNAGYQLGKQNTNVKEVETEILDQNENKELEKLEPIIIDNVEKMEENEQPSKAEEETKLGTDFTLNENPVIYANTDLNEPLKPTYQNDSYRIVAENYQMPDGTIKTVNIEDPNSQEKIDNIKATGGVLQSVSGVAKSGEEDYLENKIPTGVFDIDSINLQGNIGDQVSNLVDQELGGRSR